MWGVYSYDVALPAVKRRRLVLQNQIDGLFSALEQRAAEQTDSRDGDGHSSPRVEAADGLGFKVTMVGDSTIRVRTTNGSLTHGGQIDQIDHDLDHLHPQIDHDLDHLNLNLPL